jgi:hypothetical protein
MPHHLLVEQTEHGLQATLAVRKPKGQQDLTISLPGLTLADIESAWAAQGHAWADLYVIKSAFAALRVIWLANGTALRWNVLHVADKPFDSLELVTMTPADWPHGKIIVETAV